MTSHRRRKSETMPSSFKDKKRDSLRGKEKTDGQESHTVPLPLLKKTVYIDVKNGKQAEVMEDHLNKLGAIVEKFLSREINYVISSSAPPTTKAEERSSTEDNPASPSFSVPSPFSSIPSPTPPSDTKAAVVSRGKALAQIAYARSRASTVVTNAEKWGIKVVSVETASKWLEREIQKTKMENGNSNTKKEVPKKEKEVQKAKKKVVKRKKKVLKGRYIKFEAINRMYRPIKLELEKWPKVNVLAPPGLNPYCEVKMKLQNFLRRQSSMRNARACMSASSGKGSLRKTWSMSSIKESPSLVPTTLQATPDVVAVPINTAGDVKRHLGLANRRRPDKLQGYCECCRIKYKDMNEHIKDDEHQAFARDKSKYESLDTLLQRVPSTSQFLQDILLRHCVQKRTETQTVPQNNSNGSRKAAPKLDIEVLPVISPLPSEATPNTAEEIVPSNRSHKSPNITKSISDFAKSDQPQSLDSKENGEDKTEDEKQHAVVIRRRTPSGCFVSPRRREPTPSKRPWMQERSMVFRDSPMASLQPSDVSKALTYIISDTPSANLFQNSNRMSPIESKPKSIVRSLIRSPNFVSSLNNGVVSERSDEKATEEEVSDCQPQNCPDLEYNQNNTLEMDSRVSELDTESSTVKSHLQSHTITHDIFIALGHRVEEQPKVSTKSPDVFVPSLADRVKRRRSKVCGVEETQPENKKGEKLLQKNVTIVNSYGQGVKIHDGLNEHQMDDNVEQNVLYEKTISPVHSGERLSLNEKHNIFCSKNTENNTKKSDRIKKKGKRRLSRRDKSVNNKVDENNSNENLLSKTDIIKDHEKTCANSLEPIMENHPSQPVIDSLGEKFMENVSLTDDETEAYSMESNVHGNQIDGVSVHLPLPDAEIDNSLQQDSPIKKKKKRKDLKKSKSLRITKHEIKKMEKRAVKHKSKRRRSDSYNQEQGTSPNAAESVKCRVRQCRRNVQEGFYADYGDDKFGTISDFENEPGLTIEQEIAEEEETMVDEGSETSENTEDTDQVNATASSYVELKLNRITESGKRIFRGKTFHTTNANWELKSEKERDCSDNCSKEEPVTPDVKSEKEINSADKCYENEPVTPNVVKCVKNRCSCTLFNHEGQYTNCDESESSSRQNDIKYKNLSNETPRSASQNKQLKHSAVVVRRIPSLSTNLTKGDRTWCKFLSRKDWTQSEDDSNSPVCQSQVLGNPEVTEASGHGVENLAPPSSDVKKTFKLTSNPARRFRTSENTNIGGVTSQKLINENYQSPKRKISRSKNSKSSQKEKGGKGRIHLGKINLDVEEKEIMRSPRLKLKIKRDLESDCYSSTLEEIQDDFDSRKKCNELSPVNNRSNHPSTLDNSDTVDLLDTPRRSHWKSDDTAKHPSVRNFKISPLSSPPLNCIRDSRSMKSPRSKLSRIKRKHSDAESETCDDQPSTSRLGSSVNECLHQRELRESCQELEHDISLKSKPAKRRKRETSREIDIKCEQTNGSVVDIRSPRQRNRIKDSIPCIVENSSNEFMPSTNCLSNNVSKSKQASHKSERTENAEHTSHSKYSYKSRKSKRKLSLSDEATLEVDNSKKRKLDPTVSDTAAVFSLQNDVIGDNNMLMKTNSESNNTNKKFRKFKTLETKTVNRDESNDKIYSERSGGNNIGDLLNFVPTFSSPGKTDSSWDNACDSYLSTSLKISDQTPGSNSKSFTFNSAGGSVMWSPFKHTSPGKRPHSYRKSFLSKSESGAKGGCSSLGGSNIEALLSEKQSHTVTTHGCLTPTKKRNSLHNVQSSPSIQKVDSIVSFNHMSPQRLNFSPIKLNSPLQNLERSPSVQKVDTDISFNHMSPQRLTFSPKKSSELQYKKSTVRKQL